MSFEDILNRHNDCKVVMMPRMWKNKVWPTMALYCQDHVKLIKWLSDHQYGELRGLVEELPMTKVDERDHHLRLKKIQKPHISNGSSI